MGSILGPVLFNIFINDIFHFVRDCKICNYADDNTLSCADHLLSKVIEKLVRDRLLLIQWFAGNHTKATPEKFNQVVAVGECTYKENISFNLNNNVINCAER